MNKKKKKKLSRYEIKCPEFWIRLNSSGLNGSASGLYQADDLPNWWQMMKTVFVGLVWLKTVYAFYLENVGAFVRIKNNWLNSIKL